MPIPLPPSGYSSSALEIEALTVFLEAETSLSWRGGVFAPNKVDTLIGTIRPYIEVPPMGDSSQTTLSVQFLLQCKIVDTALLDSQVRMFSWRDEIANILKRLQINGVSGTYQGTQLNNVLSGIRPTAIAGSGWTQLAVERMEARTGEAASLIVLSLLMNYAIAMSRLGFEKEIY